METLHAPVEVFYSFTEADAPLLEQLERHLSVLRHERFISTWYKRQIAAGSNWQVELDHHLSTASLIFLLVSPDFLASGYQYGVELDQALQRHEANEARVIPILLRACDWEGAPFCTLQAIPRNGKPVTSWRNRDEAWADVVQDIRKALEELLNGEGKKKPLSSEAQQSVTAQKKSKHLAPFPPVWNVPYRYAFFFTGRDRLVERLFANFDTVGKPF